jgi:hypothetical protein
VIGRRLRTLATLAAPFELEIFRFSGRLHGSGERATLLHAGTPENANFVAASLLAVEGCEALEPLATPLALGGWLDRAVSSTTGATADVPWLWRFALPPRMAHRFPAWVSQEIRAPEGEPLALAAAAAKEASRHCRREDYRIEFTQDPQDFRRFFGDYYRRYIGERFGPGAVLVDEARFLDDSRGMTLAKLLAGGDWVAGMLFRLRGSSLSLGWFGSATTPPRAGASEVLDASVLAHAAGLGCRRAILGHSRPSLADGVVRYKARLGAVLRPTRFPQRVIALAAPEPGTPVAAALAAARFVGFPEGRGEARELGLNPPLSAGSRATARPT